MNEEPTDKDAIARKVAIARAIERTSDIYPEISGRWCFDHMWRDGTQLKHSYRSRLEAEYRLAIVCLGIAADLQRLDIRLTMDFLEIKANEICYDPETSTPDVGMWTAWLPKASLVHRLPGRKNYFDHVLW